MPNERIPASADERQVFVFVSFSMPSQSLKLWSEQAGRIQVPLLLRGFVDNSFLKTTAKTKTVFEKEGVEVFIDPESFEKFGITTVPAVVIANAPCIEETCPPHSFDTAFGDTTLADALRLIAAKGSHEGQLTAKTLLKKIEPQHE